MLTAALVLFAIIAIGIVTGKFLHRQDEPYRDLSNPRHVFTEDDLRYLLRTEGRNVEDRARWWGVP